MLYHGTVGSPCCMYDQAFTYFQVCHVIRFPAVFNCFFLLFRKTVVNVKLPSGSFFWGDCQETEQAMYCVCVSPKVLLSVTLFLILRSTRLFLGLLGTSLGLGWRSG